MGACCCGDDTTNQIDAGMRERQQKEDQIKKILLLGSGASGKSTLFKQVKAINPPEETEKAQAEIEGAKEEAKNVIRMNLIAEMATLIARAVTYHHEETQLLNQMTDEQKENYQFRFMAPSYPEAFEVPDADAPNGKYIVNIKEAAETVVNLSKDAFSDVSAVNPNEAIGSMEESEEYWIVLGVYIHALWQQDWIQSIFSQRKGLFSLSDNIDFFLNKARLCMSPNYKVTDEDYLKVRVRTTGVILHQFPYTGKDMPANSSHKQFTITIIDVGGQRNERKKWIHSFDTIAALLFVTALNHYCEVLFEEETKNAMWESLDLFSNILDGKWFLRTPVMIFLNKEDLFKECVFAGHKLCDCFDANPDRHPNAQWGDGDFAYSEEAKYTDIEWDNNAIFESVDGKSPEQVAELYFDDVVQTQLAFITEIFFTCAEQKNKARNQSAYCHVTTATDKDNIKKVFDVVIHNAVMNQLMIAGVI